MTNSTVHGGQKCLTQGAAYNILGTVPGVKRTSLSTNGGINLKGKVRVFIQIVVSKICTIS